MILATAGLFGIVFGLIRGNSHGWTSPQVLASLVGGGLLVVAFVAWESRAATPMLPLSLFRSRGFSAASATMLLTNMGMFGVIFLVSQFLQSVLGYTPLVLIAPQTRPARQGVAAGAQASPAHATPVPPTGLQPAAHVGAFATDGQPQPHPGDHRFVASLSPSGGLSTAGLDDEPATNDQGPGRRDRRSGP